MGRMLDMYEGLSVRESCLRRLCRTLADSQR